MLVVSFFRLSASISLPDTLFPFFSNNLKKENSTPMYNVRSWTGSVYFLLYFELIVFGFLRKTNKYTDFIRIGDFLKIGLLF